MTRPCPTTHPSKYATTASGDHSNKANNPAPGGPFACAGPFGYEVIEHMFDSEADRDMATLATCEQQVGFLHAMQFRALARFAALRPSDKGNLFSEFAPDEVALALGWTRAVAGMRLALALTLTDRLPATLTALEAGEVDLRRVQKLAELTDPLPPEVA